MPNQEKKQQLMNAIDTKNLATVKRLLEEQSAGDWLNEPDVQGDTPLLKAVALGHSEIVDLLLQYGADIQKRSSTGNNALLLAAYRGHTVVVEQLLTALKVSPVNNWSDYPIDGHERAVLCQRHEQNGDTLLHAAVHSGNPELLKGLLKKYRLANATITIDTDTMVLRNLPNQLQQTPRDIAENLESSKQSYIIELLLSYGAVRRHPKSQCQLTPLTEEKSVDNTRQNLSARQQNYIRVVQEEFIRMYRLLGDIATEKVSAPSDFKGKVLQTIATVGEFIPGGNMIEAVVRSLGTTVQFLHERRQKGMPHTHAQMLEAYYGSLTDAQLEQAIKPTAHQVARSCGFAINQIMTETDIPQFARVGVSRLFEYLSRTHSQSLSHDVLWLGFFLGHSGRFVDGVTNTSLHGQQEYANIPLTAEGVYTHSGFVKQQDNQYEYAVTKNTKYGRQKNKFERMAMRWHQKEKPTLKYGYVQVTATQWRLLEKYAPFLLNSSNPAPMDQKKFESQLYRWHALTETELKDYIAHQQDAADNSPLALNDFIQKKHYPDATHCQVVFDGVFSGSRNATSEKISHCDFSGSDFSLSKWTHCQFEGLVSKQTLWVNSQWKNITIVGGTHDGSVLDGMHMENVRCSKAGMMQVKLRYVQLKGDCRFEELGNTLDLQLEGTDLVGSNAQVSFQSPSSEMEETLTEIRKFNKQFQSGWSTVSEKISKLQQDMTEIQTQIKDQEEKLEGTMIARRQHSLRLHALEELKQDEAIPPQQLRTWHLPQAMPKDLFLERPDLWRTLLSQLQATSASTAPTQVIVLQGMPGSGKTELAKHLIHHPESADHFRAWLLADSRANLLLEYRRLAETMGWCAPGLSEEQLPLLVHEQLAQMPSPWLLVFDNVDNDIEELESLLPPKGGMVLITSRLNTWQGRPVRVQQMGLLEISDGVALLGRWRRQTISETEQEAAKALVDDLGRLPLAITQAGVYLNKYKISIEAYRERFMNDPHLLADKSLGKRPNQTVATTWHISLEALEKQIKNIPVYTYAKDMLIFCAYLRAESIPICLLRHWFEKQIEEQKSDARRFGLLNHIPFLKKPVSEFQLLKNPVSEFQTLLNGLVEYAFLSWEEGAQTVSIHRLLQKTLRIDAEQMFDFTRKETNGKNWLNLLIEEFQTEQQPTIQTETLYYHIQLTSHAKHLLKYLKDQNIILPDEQLGEIYFYFGNVYHSFGLLKQASHYREQELKIWQKYHNGSPNRLVAQTFNSLGRIYQGLGDLEQAEVYYVHSLDMMRLLCGEDAENLTIAVSLDNLGEMHAEQKNWDQAKMYYKQSLEIKRSLYDKKPHPSTAWTLNSLGWIYLDLDKFYQAKECFEEALEMNGHGTSDMATGFDNFGVLHKAWGEFKQASDEFKQASDEFEQAQKYFQKALVIQNIFYRNRPHPNVAVTLNNLGQIYLNLNKLIRDKNAKDLITSGLAQKKLSALEQAQKCFQKALEIQLAFYHNRPHPDVAITFNKLGWTHLNLSKSMQEISLEQPRDRLWEPAKVELNKAKTYFQEALKIQRAFYHNRPHSGVAVTLDNLGRVHEELSDYVKDAMNQALTYYKQSLKMRRSLYPENHPDVLLSLENIREVCNVLHDDMTGSCSVCNIQPEPIEEEPQMEDASMEDERPSRSTSLG